MPHLKHLSLTVFLLLSLAMQAQWVSIPDTNFRNKLIQLGYGTCFNGSLMDTTCSEVVNTISLDVSNSNISSVEGVQYFDNLSLLRCFENQLASLPQLPASLLRLDCSFNQLNTLPALPATLYWLECGNNQLTSLPWLPSLLTYLHCNNNQLSNLPMLPDSLVRLECYYNQLSTLPTLPASLYRLVCANNQLTSLPALPDSIAFLNCDDNPSLFCMPRLNKVSNFSFVHTGISCLPNYPQLNFTSNPPLNSVPICDLLNTNSCSIYGSLLGKAFYDSIQNCTLDSSETGLFGLKIQLVNNYSVVGETITSVNGDFYFVTDTGTFEIGVYTPNIPFYPVACPSGGVLYDTLTASYNVHYNRDFFLRCKPGFDLEARSIATPSPFRPANLTTVNISAGDASNFYGARCAAGVSGAVTTTFSGPVQFISAAPGALVPSVNGNTLTYTIADFGAVNFFDDFNIILQTDTSAQIGQQVCFTVSVTPIAGDNNPANNTLTHCFTIVNSYDPNDKTAYPAGNTDTAQKELTYTIRFQNTGNAEAQHIYITDTLSQYIDESTFQLLAYSHQPMVQLKEKAIRFNFPNINLPDSFSNEPASHGYVQYKVRLKENLPIGTEIENTAFIYFDFNAPVITNTTVNTISVVSGVAASRMADIGFGIYPNPTTGVFVVDVPKELIGEVLSVTDVTGRVAYQSDIRHSKSEINIATSGVYFVRIGGSVKRLVVR